MYFTHDYTCISLYFMLHALHTATYIQWHKRQCKIFCKSEFCVHTTRIPEITKVQTEHSRRPKRTHIIQQKKTCYCTETLETEYVSWISIKTKIGTHAAGWRPMKQKIRIYAIWWLHWKKVQRQQSLVVGKKKMKSLLVCFPSFWRQEYRNSTWSVCQHIWSKRNIKAVATVAKWNHSDTHTHTP